jgi:hypothetical protein
VNSGATVRTLIQRQRNAGRSSVSRMDNRGTEEASSGIEERKAFK